MAASFTVINSYASDMELLLNLIWLAVASTALLVFMRRRIVSTSVSQVPLGSALLALGCMLFVLFPVISASDDLHPTQAVLEDASKRVQYVIAPMSHSNGPAADLVPMPLTISLLCALIALQGWQPISRTAPVMFRARTPREGRSPPSL
jgi:hypothetical protein